MTLMQIVHLWNAAGFCIATGFLGWALGRLRVKGREAYEMRRRHLDMMDATVAKWHEEMQAHSIATAIIIDSFDLMTPVLKSRAIVYMRNERTTVDAVNAWKRRLDEACYGNADLHDNG